MTDEVRCDERQRGPKGPPKPWPILTARIHGTEVCAKCLRGSPA